MPEVTTGYVIEVDGKRVGSEVFADPVSAAREAEALDAMFPGRYHDVGTVMQFNDLEHRKRDAGQSQELGSKPCQP